MMCCDSTKFPFPNKRIAAKFAKMFALELGFRAHLYPCPYCGEVHMTTHFSRKPRSARSRKQIALAAGGVE
jgi:predicted RNA-binding Zn-ribbon protein involved in translation (DUF1610 family)